MMISHRRPVVAGMFYPGSPDGLSRELTRLCGAPRSGAALNASLGLIAPHAGYVYSGGVAGGGYKELAARGTPKWAIILGSNHTGMGQPISIATEGVWETPLGSSPIATEIALRLVDAGVRVAPEAFLREHSIEVQLPFLQHLFGLGVPFVPICVMLPPIDDVVALGEAYHKLIEERLSICGGGAITALMSCARTLVWEARLVSYATSGDMTGDRSAVVGYAAISFIGGSNDK